MLFDCHSCSVFNFFFFIEKGSSRDHPKNKISFPNQNENENGNSKGLFKFDVKFKVNSGQNDFFVFLENNWPTWFAVCFQTVHEHCVWSWRVLLFVTNTRFTSFTFRLQQSLCLVKGWVSQPHFWWSWPPFCNKPLLECKRKSCYRILESADCIFESFQPFRKFLLEGFHFHNTGCRISNAARCKVLLMYAFFSSTVFPLSSSSAINVQTLCLKSSLLSFLTFSHLIWNFLSLLIFIVRIGSQENSDSCLN